MVKFRGEEVDRDYLGNPLFLYEKIPENAREQNPFDFLNDFDNWFAFMYMVHSEGMKPNLVLLAIGLETSNRQWWSKLARKGILQFEKDQGISNEVISEENRESGLRSILEKCDNEV